MRRAIPDVILLAIAIAALLLGFRGAAWPQEAGRGEWFKSLKQPDSGISCCDVSDCHPLESEQYEWRGSNWVAMSWGQMTVVPQAKVVQDPPSLDGRAYLCDSPSRHIYCFVPPSPGS